jgi:type I restriction enzyme M protein
MFTDEQIAKVKAIYNAWQTGNGYKDIPELCKSETIADIEKQNSHIQVTNATFLFCK